jgi:hypothetical protein
VLVLIAPQYLNEVWVECWDKRGKRKGSPESRILRCALYIELDIKRIKGISKICIPNTRCLFDYTERLQDWSQGYHRLWKTSVEMDRCASLVGEEGGDEEE